MQQTKVETVTLEWLKEKKVCNDAVEYAASRLDGGKPVSECIEKLHRADWLLWLLWHSGTVNIRQLCQLAAQAVARDSQDASNDTGVVSEATSQVAWSVSWVAQAVYKNAGAAVADAFVIAPAVWSIIGAAWSSAQATGIAEGAENLKMCSAIRTELSKREFKNRATQ